jgi:polar amino acid transport system permease protein
MACANADVIRAPLRTLRFSPVTDNLKQALDLSLFWEYRAILLAGLVSNALVFLCAAVLALSVGVGAALLRVHRLLPFRLIGTLHVEVFRNAPDYIMLVWVHFVLPLIIAIVIRRRVEFHPFASAVVALGLVYSGYFAETFRAGMEAIPRGNLDAAHAFGMSEGVILWRIILPQVVRRMLPEALNQFVSLFKATTIVSLIAVPDLMYAVSMVTQQEMRPLPLYTGAAITYFLLIFLLASAVRGFSERWRRKILA